MGKTPRDIWTDIASRELGDTDPTALGRDYGGLVVDPVYFGEGDDIPGVRGS